MNQVKALLKQKSNLLKSIELCFEPQKYVPLKNKLRLVERRLAIESGTYENFSLIVALRKRIDELETDKTRATIEKNSCNDLGRYRRLFDSIRAIEEAIAINEDMIKQAGG